MPAGSRRSDGGARPGGRLPAAAGAVAAALLLVLALAGCVTGNPYPGRKLQEALDAFNEAYTIVWGRPFDLKIPTHLPEQELRRAARLFDQAAKQSREALDYYIQVKEAHEEVHGYGTATWKAAPVASSLEDLSSYLARYMELALEMREAARQRAAGDRDGALRTAGVGFAFLLPPSPDLQEDARTVLKDPDPFWRRLVEDFPLDANALLMEALRAAVGPEVVDDPARLAASPRAFYVSARLHSLRSQQQASRGEDNPGQLAVADRRAALQLLEKAFQLGFEDWDALDSDDWLDPLRGMPEFQKLVAEHRRAEPAWDPLADLSGTLAEATPELVAAADSGEAARVRDLLRRGAEVDGRDAFGQTALMLAAQGGHVEVARMLLEAGAAASARDDHGTTPLMSAAFSGSVEILGQVLARGAEVDAVTKAGWTALMIAARRGKTEAVRALIQAGADVSLRNGDGLTALDIARQGGYSQTAAALTAAGGR